MPGRKRIGLTKLRVQLEVALSRRRNRTTHSSRHLLQLERDFLLRRINSGGMLRRFVFTKEVRESELKKENDSDVN